MRSLSRSWERGVWGLFWIFKRQGSVLEYLSLCSIWWSFYQTLFITLKNLVSTETKTMKNSKAKGDPCMKEACAIQTCLQGERN